MWAQRRLRYLREHRPILYANLKTSGKLRSHLADVEEPLVKDCAASEGITEQLKAEKPMEWVQRMNNIKVRAREIINNDLIYA